MIHRLVLGISLLFLMGLLGCQTPTTYYWGNYESLVYSEYDTPGKIPPGEQIEILKQDIADAQTKNKPLPPGFYAHLGYLYFQVGAVAAAKASFTTEKENFPESAVFMDRLISRTQ
jgi:hypothetical protein